MRLSTLGLIAAFSPMIWAAPETTDPVDPDDEGPPDQPLLADRNGEHEIDNNPFETLIKKCDKWEFPEDSFKAQPDLKKVYLKVDQTADGPFKNNNLTQFATVFGIRIVAEKSVDSKKITHVANVLANVIDQNGDGKPDNEKLVQELHKFHPMLFVMGEADQILQLMNAQDPDEGFPLELKFCPYAFDFEEASKINPGGSIGDATCEQDDGKNDRTLAFVLDHLVGRGFGQVLDEDKKKKLDKVYSESIDAGTFDPENTGCPAEATECGKVMFASWGLSTLMGFDKCWCEQAQALKFCDKDQLKKNEPELADILGDLFPDVVDTATKDYSPKDKSVLVK